MPVIKELNVESSADILGSLTKDIRHVALEGLNKHPALHILELTGSENRWVAVTAYIHTANVHVRTCTSTWVGLKVPAKLSDPVMYLDILALSTAA